MGSEREACQSGSDGKRKEGLDIERTIVNGWNEKEGELAKDGAEEDAGVMVAAKALTINQVRKVILSSVEYAAHFFTPKLRIGKTVMTPS